MWRYVLVLTVLIACGDNGNKPVDAAIDSAPDAPLMCGANGPHAGTSVTYYINTEGVTLTAGTCSDSRTNCTSLVMADKVVPPFYDGIATRQQTIDTILADVTTALAPYAIDVVTTRPASGDYYMTVLGGSSATIIGTAGVLSLAPAVCNATNRDAISIVFDSGLLTPDQYATSLLSDLGALVGLPTANKNGDCMCRTGSTCSNFNGICTYGQNVPVDSSANGCGMATSYEQSLLAERLGCR